MSRVEKTVFLSYRRTNVPWALAISQNLTTHGYDVFFDFTGIASGDFERIILENIQARAHFVVLLTPSALERCADPGDWLRREIETALETRRNVVPLLLETFDFGMPPIGNQLTGTLEALKHFNGLRVPAEYFSEAMTRLRERYLSVSLDAVLHPASTNARRAAVVQQAAVESAPPVEEKELTAQEYFERGFASREVGEELRCYTEAIRLKPDFVYALRNRGIARTLSRDLVGALQDFDEVLRLKPDDAEIFVARGLTHSAIGDLENALRDYDAAILLKPEFVKAYIKRAYLYVEDGNSDAAFHDLEKALLLCPNDAEAIATRGYAHTLGGALAIAREDFGEAIRLEPDNARAFRGRGRVHEREGHYEKALRDYGEAIRLNDRDPQTFYDRGRVLKAIGDLEGADADFTEAARLDEMPVTRVRASTGIHGSVVNDLLDLRDRFTDTSSAMSQVVREIEIRDSIHGFIRLDQDELEVLNSRWFQRLRQIHQLALSYLVYPGATHRRFEHCLGAMELAGRVFDVVTAQDNVTDEVRSIVPEIAGDRAGRAYWRRIVRIAALCRDIGHLAFSHVAEHALLPSGWSHERLGKQILLSEEMKNIFASMTPPLKPEDVVKLALGPKKADGLRFSNWEAILSEIIAGDAFGVDRIDYLLRDSHHMGVAYGKFDHYRLIDALRVLKSERGNEPSIGMEYGGLHSAEGLLVARYMMYSQVYFHPVRRIYDLHLQEFLSAWLPGGKFPTDPKQHLELTDNEVGAAMTKAAADPLSPGHDSARRILQGRHFKVLYSHHPGDLTKKTEAGALVFEAARAEFGAEHVRRDAYTEKGAPPDFPVRMKDDRVSSAILLSDVLGKLPLVSVDTVYVSPEKRKEATEWLQKNRESIVTAGH